MADVIDETVAMVQQKEAELIELKRAVNTFCQMKGMPPRYADTELRVNSGTGVTRKDQFYGKPLAAAVREYLQSQGHAVLASDMVAALERGGFDFDAMGWNEEFRERSLIVSLVKNPKYFHRLPNGTFGLPEWYPNLPKKKEEGDKVKPVDVAAVADVATAGDAAGNNGGTEPPAATVAEARKRLRKTKPPAPAGTDGAAT